MRIADVVWLIAIMLPLAGGCDWRRQEDRDASLCWAAHRGDPADVQKWIARGAHVNGRNREGNTALHEAARGGHMEVARLLLGCGARINALNRDGLTPVLLAVREDRRRLVEHLVKQGASVTLHVPAYLGDSERTAELIAAGADVNAPGPYGWTPLHVAVFRRRPNIIRLLILAAADLDIHAKGSVWQSDRRYGSPLHLAAHCGFQDMVEVLVDAGADVNARTRWGETPLYIAVEQGRTGMVEFLLARGADADITGNRHYCDDMPLGLAVSMGRLDLVKALLAGGADASIKSNTGKTPLHAAIRDSYPLPSDEAPSRGQSSAERERYRLEHRRTSVRLAREMAAQLLAYGADPRTADEDGVTPLHRASHDGLTEIMELLADAGADVNARASGTLTPYGVIYRRDIGYALSSGMTPLHVAVGSAEPDAVEVLLKHGADVRVTTEGGHTPLHYASALGSTRCMEMLLAAGADVNVQDDDGATPLAHALLTGETEAAEMLIAAGAQRADLTAYTSRATHLPSGARGLLHRAISAHTGQSGSQVGDLDWARLLLDNGADPDERNESGQTPLHLAADWQMSEFVSLLIDRGAEVGARDMGRTTPLLYAASGGDPNLVLSLLDHGADVNARDVDGDRPLHNAARGGHVEVVRLLLAHDADTAVWNRRDRTPLDEAVRSGDKELIRLLTEADQSRTRASSGDFGEGR